MRAQITEKGQNKIDVFRNISKRFSACLQYLPWITSFRWVLVDFSDTKYFQVIKSMAKPSALILL